MSTPVLLPPETSQNPKEDLDAARPYRVIFNNKSGMVSPCAIAVMEDIFHLNPEQARRAVHRANQSPGGFAVYTGVKQIAETKKHQGNTALTWHACNCRDHTLDAMYFEMVPA